jgi:hypothetical protein
MAVSISHVPKTSCIEVAGDVRATLYVPAQPSRMSSDGEVLVYPYYIALSDGSLIQASNYDDPEFYVVVEGAGKLRVDNEGKTLLVDCRIEWIILGANHATTALADCTPARLPLLDGLID